MHTIKKNVVSNNFTGVFHSGSLRSTWYLVFQISSRSVQSGPQNISRSVVSVSPFVVYGRILVLFHKNKYVKKQRYLHEELCCSPFLPPRVTKKKRTVELNTDLLILLCKSIANHGNTTPPHHNHQHHHQSQESTPQPTYTDKTNTITHLCKKMDKTYKVLRKALQHQHNHQPL